jgi:hypothetical protein
MTGLDMHWSDLNVLVTFRTRSLTEADILKQVERFNNFLKNTSTSVVRSEFAERKNITLMKLWVNQKLGGKRVEIIFRRFMVQTLPKNDSVIADYLKDYPISRMIYFLVRKLFRLSGLDDPLDGGITSFSILLMIIGFLQMIESSGRKGSDKNGSKAVDSNQSVLSTKCEEANDCSADDLLSEHNHDKYVSNCRVGEIFLNFIYFYGFSFDYGKNFISTYISRGSKCHPFLIKPDSALSSLMIVNPYDHNLILTKSFRKTSAMKQLFKLVYNNIFSMCLCGKHCPDITAKTVTLPKTQIVVSPYDASSITRSNCAELPLFDVSLRQAEQPKAQPVPVKSTQDPPQPVGNNKPNLVKSRLRANSSIFNNFKNDSAEESSRKNDFGYKIQALLAFNFSY